MSVFLTDIPARANRIGMTDVRRSAVPSRNALAI
jgi:hypothetical protein